MLDRLRQAVFAHVLGRANLSNGLVADTSSPKSPSNRPLPADGLPLVAGRDGIGCELLVGCGIAVCDCCVRIASRAHRVARGGVDGFPGGPGMRIGAHGLGARPERSVAGRVLERCGNGGRERHRSAFRCGGLIARIFPVRPSTFRLCAAANRQKPGELEYWSNSSACQKLAHAIRALRSSRIPQRSAPKPSALE